MAEKNSNDTAVAAAAAENQTAANSPAPTSEAAAPSAQADKVTASAESLSSVVTHIEDTHKANGTWSDKVSTEIAKVKAKLEEAYAWLKTEAETLEKAAAAEVDKVTETVKTDLKKANKKA